MPIYEYACKSCNHTLDALQKMDEDPLVYCPSCGDAGLKRLISAPRFRLKGEGWYETDFKKDKQRNLLSADAESSAKDKSDGKSGKEDSTTSGGSSEKATETKKLPDKKADSKVDST